jgi:MFS family permease
LPTLALIWGIITTLTGVTQNFAGFATSRFFLGLVESGFIPGCIFYLSMWYKRNEQNYRTALLLSTATLAGAFGGIFVSNGL